MKEEINNLQGAMTPTDNKTILIVEDDENTSSLIALYLEREGFSAVTAGDGETTSRPADEMSGENQVRSEWPSRLKPSEHKLLSSAVSGAEVSILKQYSKPDFIFR